MILGTEFVKKRIIEALLVRLGVLFGPVVPVRIVEERLFVVEHAICSFRRQSEKDEKLPTIRKEADKMANRYHWRQ
jgi:hypothetical protein